MANIERDIAVLNQAIHLRTRRQELIASNIANADTPNYKARDLDFRAAMEAAMSGLSLATTTPGHIAALHEAPGSKALYRTDTQSAVDGNTVDMDIERTAMAENSFSYQLLSQLLSEEFKDLRTAMSSTSG